MMPFRSNSAVTGEWECMECGYIEEGVQARRPLKCPECGAPGNALEFFSYDDDDATTWAADSEEGNEDEFEDENEELDFDDYNEDDMLDEDDRSSPF